MTSPTYPSTIAYFSMEICLEQAIPTYSGGLGVLAGDTLRSAADLESVLEPELRPRAEQLRRIAESGAGSTRRTSPGIVDNGRRFGYVPLMRWENEPGLSSLIASRVRTWVDKVKSSLGVTPIIYTGKYFWRDEVGGNRLIAATPDPAQAEGPMSLRQPVRRAMHGVLV